MNTVDTGAPASVWSRGRRGLDRYGWRALSKEVGVRSMRPALAPVAARELRRRAAGTDGVDEVLDLAYGFRAFGHSIRPCQSRWEFERLLTEVEQIHPRAMMEIGTANGGSLFAFAQVCASDAQVISVDLPQGAFGGGYPAWKIPLYKSFAREGQNLDLIRADSHSPATLARVKERLDGRPLDFLFIDGDHTFAGVQTDFELYRSLVRPGGLIAFHDIAAPHADSPAVNDAGEVPEFWEHLTTHYDGRALIDPEGSGCFGIGLLAA